jgi:hypothetical protein
MSSDTTSTIVPISTTPSTAFERVRNQWALVQAKKDQLPDTLRAAWERLSERLRSAFDVPTKAELAQLLAKLDELDAKIAALATSRVQADSVPAKSKITAAKRVQKPKAR